MALQSQLFAGDDKLEAAAVSHPAHIVPGARGPHVGKIQQALIEVANAPLEADGIYGPATAAAVAEFKRTCKPPILNTENKIDNIVGIKTMAALDALLPKGARLRFNLGGLAITLVDIVVNFRGAPGASPQDAEEALPLAFLTPSYVPAPDPAKRNLMRHRTNGSLLLRLAHTTTEIGAKRLPVFNNVMNSITGLLNATDPVSDNALIPGRIFVYGTSSGGRNAIDFVGFLSQRKLLPHFVAPIEASFFQADTADRPNSPGRVLNVPTFTLAAAAGPSAALVLRVPNRRNFFQARGNQRGQSLNPFAEPFFSSDMAGGLEEIHGRVEGFTNEEIPVTGILGKTDDAFHDECDVLGRRKVQLLIAAELNGP